MEHEVRMSDAACPKPGDYTICLNCSQWIVCQIGCAVKFIAAARTSILRFTDNLRVRLPTSEEIWQMPRNIYTMMLKTSLACRIVQQGNRTC